MRIRALALREVLTAVGLSAVLFFCSSAVHERPARGEAKIRVAFGAAQLDDAATVTLPAGIYDLRVSGVAAQPTTSLVLSFRESGAETETTSFVVELDFDGLEADPGDRAGGGLNAVELVSDALNTLTVPVQWSGAAVLEQREMRFPLSVSPLGRYLVEADGDPFFLHGEAAWSMLVQLTETEVDAYLANRKALGVNTLMVNLIESFFSDNPPQNINGDEPFATPGDFSTPNDDYFDFMVTLIEKCRDEGFAVMMTPVYFGFEGGAQGWWSDLNTAPLAEVTAYGQYVGNKFGGLDNIIWMSGGDYTAPEPSTGLTNAIEIRDQILAIDSNALHTGHWTRGDDSETRMTGSHDIVGVYTNWDNYTEMASVYAANTEPVFFLEGDYEVGSGQPNRRIRASAWWAVTSGAMGHFFGVFGIWNYPSSWRDELDTEIPAQMDTLQAQVNTLEWQVMTPDTGNLLVTAGTGTGDATARATYSGINGEALIFLPPAGSSTREITLDLSVFAPGMLSLTWLDPSDGSRDVAGSYANTDIARTVTAPGANSAGENDWVLVIEPS